MQNISVVVPSLNPDENLEQVISSLFSCGFSDIIVINDGSGEQYDPLFEKAAKNGCTVLRHSENRGKGAALKTAFQFVLQNRQDCRGVVTVDADNQHRAADAAKTAEALLENGGLVLGVRDFDKADVPERSRLGNKITRRLFRLVGKRYISDTQTGLRGIDIKLLPSLLQLSGDRYEFETAVLLFCCNSKAKITEVPIETVYIEQNSGSHFNPLKDSLSVMRLLFGFAASSVFCSAIDLSSYFLAVRILEVLPLKERLLAATVFSRVLSSLCNYLLNRQTVFGKVCVKKGSVSRYYLLCLCQMLASWLLVWGLTLIIGGSSMLSKVIVDTFLFFISFYIQRDWVFAKTCEE